MNRIGIVPMSAKPYHAGHDALIRLARFECEQVIVFVSTSDRVRKGEYPIHAETMKKLWEEVILDSLPSEVYVQFVPNPVSAVYEMLGVNNEAVGIKEELVVYSDPVDMERNFPQKSMVKYCHALVKAQKISRRFVPRQATIDISGTQMRAWLQHGEKAKFIANLPKELDGELVWHALHKR